MSRLLTASVLALLATAAQTVAVTDARAMHHVQPQLAAHSQIILVDDDDDDDHRYDRRYRGDDDGWTRFRGYSRDNDDDDDDDDD